MPRNQCHLASGSDLSDTEIISKWHVRDCVQQCQYSVQDFQYHCNDPRSEKGEEAQAQYAAKASLKAQENREAGRFRRGLPAGFNPFVTGHIQVTPALLGERGKQSRDLETKALVSLVPLCDSA